MNFLNLSSVILLCCIGFRFDIDTDVDTEFNFKEESPKY